MEKIECTDRLGSKALTRRVIQRRKRPFSTRGGYRVFHQFVEFSSSQKPVRQGMSEGPLQKTWI